MNCTFILGFWSLRGHFQSLWTPFEVKANNPKPEFVYSSLPTCMNIYIFLFIKVQDIYIKYIANLSSSFSSLPETFEIKNNRNNLVARVWCFRHSNHPALLWVQYIGRFPRFWFVRHIFKFRFFYNPCWRITTILQESNYVTVSI